MRRSISGGGASVSLSLARAFVAVLAAVVLAFIGLVVAPRPAHADTLQELASWNFFGGNLTSGDYTISTYNGATVENYGDLGSEALSLRGGSQYAQLPNSLFANAGDSLTVEFDAKSRIDDSGNYFTLAVGQDSYKYLMFYLSKTTVKAVISDDQWRNEQGNKITLAGGDEWHKYKLVVDDTKLALFRDNTLIIYKADTGIKMSDLGGTTTYIGKSFYSGDAYWNGGIDNLTVSKGADSITVATSVTVAGADTVGETLTTQLTATVAPEDALNKDVTWSSSDTAIATVDATGKVTGVGEGTATITATNEVTGVSGTWQIAVAPLSDQDKAQADLDAAVAQVSTTTTENLPLATVGEHNTSIVWTSSDDALVTPTNTSYTNPNANINVADDPYKGGGVITRSAYGDGDTTVTLTATVTAGDAQATRDIEVTIKEKPRTAPDTGYAAANFKGDSGNDEQIWMSSTQSSNFFSFQVRNNGNAVLANDADTGGLRDAYILRSHYGDKYYLIATDLKVYAAGAGWGNVQSHGSTKVEVYESKDLMNWTRTNGEGNGGITINDEYAGMTWAPEAYWDDDLNAYVVFFSSRLYNDKEHTDPYTNPTTSHSSYAQVRYAITRDFVHFTPPSKWQDTGYARIDSTVMKIGSYYYRLTKNEEDGSAGNYITTGKSIFLERSKHLTAPTTESSPDQDPETGWQLLEQNLLPFEGPEFVKLNESDPINTDDNDGYVLLSDNFNYRAFMTTGDALSQTNWTNTMVSRYPNFHNESYPVTAAPGAQGFIASGSSGGLPSIVRHGAFVNVPQTVLDVMETWTTGNPTQIQAVDSTTAVEYDAGSRVAKATVTAADEGTVAGSVQFTIGEWTQAVKLDADGVAQVTVPNQVSGSEISAAYDGYTDGLVNASEDTTNADVVYVQSSDATLASLRVANQDIDLDAAAEGTATLSVDDPAEVTEDDVTYELSDAEHAHATVEVTDGVVSVTVTAEDGTTKTYAVTLEASENPEPDPGTGGGSGNDTQLDGESSDPTADQSNTAADSESADTLTGGLPSTGDTVMGLSALAVLLAIAGIGLLAWRKRQA